VNRLRLLLVHGSFHGAWCWDHLIPELAARDIEAYAIDLPFTSLADDAAAVASAIEEARGPLIVVGHSYGGAVVTLGAGPSDGRRGATHLVYLAAILTDPSQPLDLKTTPGMSAIQFDSDGLAYVDPSKATQALFHRCQPDVAAWATSRLRPMPLGDFGSTPDREEVAWREVPSSYVVCTDDQAIDPSDQRRMAANANECLELDSDHSPFLSTISPLADLLTRVASQVASAPSGQQLIAERVPDERNRTCGTIERREEE
jgi:pimeloyl-ACP methyl ester carboxylesterase